jgi:RNAse (barnase) inhibitor barstar
VFVSLAKVACHSITDWESFHDEFNRVFAFPDLYGRNMDAWIDCMSSLDAPDDVLTSIHVEPGKVLGLALDGAKSLKNRCPEIYDTLVECAAFVNWRRIERDERPVIALSYNS